jgi:hypothetical protein
MKPELIVMLTHHDKTVDHAIELFEELKDRPVRHWGFKDVGLDKERMKRLVDLMKASEKTTFLEVVSLSEREGVAGARLAVECGFDVLMGTVYFDSIHEVLKGSPVRYYPFVGRVHGHPSILDGPIDEVVDQTRALEERGVHGFDLLSYRYTGDALRLLREVVRATRRVPVVSAGSIDSYDRIADVRDAGAWGFTIGSAFFDKRFVPGGSFGENMMAVWNWLEGNRIE